MSEPFQLSCDAFCRLCQLALTHAFDAYAQMDEHGVVEQWQCQSGVALGWACADVVGQPLSSTLFADGQRRQFLDAFQRCAQQVHQSPQLCRIHIQGVDRLGAPVPLELSLARVEFRHGHKVLATFRDLSDRLKAQEKLRIADAIFDLFEGVVVTNADKTILRINDAFTAITGYTAEETLGKVSSIFRADKTTDTVYHELRRVLSTQRFWQGEVWDRRKNGERYPAWLRISAVNNADGVVGHYVISFVDNTAQYRSEERIHRLAFFDSLTELPNRRLLMDRLGRACHRSDRQDSLGAVLVIDLDNFKDVNDALGHDVGDQVLTLTARRLEQCLKSDDTIARVGGDEFIVVLEGLSEELVSAANRAELVANRLRLALIEPIEVHAQSIQMTISIGAVIFDGRGVSEGDLIKHAEAAMYQAKHAGRNRVRLFHSEQQNSLERRFELITSMRKGFPQQFMLHYQVQVNAHAQVTGVEALVRWRHPSLGNVSPALFIPLAEESDFVLQLGAWVMETACRQLVAWQNSELTHHLTMSVNVSARQFHSPEFVQSVIDAIDHTGARPELVQLELTEGLMLHDVADVIEKMKVIKGMGINFSIDDFGTGYSSLSYLKRLPIDELKIDQSFVRDLRLDPNDQTIARTVINLGHSLGLRVIAEGVETVQQRDILLQLGCDAFQGFLYGRPVDVGQLELVSELGLV